MYLLNISNNKFIYYDDNIAQYHYLNNKIYNLIMPSNKVSVIYRNNNNDTYTMSLITFEMTRSGSIFKSIYNKIYNPQFNINLQAESNPNGARYNFYITNNGTRSILLNNQSYTYNYMKYYCLNYYYAYSGEVTNCIIDFDTSNTIFLNNSKVYCTAYIVNQ